jgi:hypothetical protein
MATIIILSRGRRFAACNGRPTRQFLRKPQTPNEMHTRVGANVLKLFRRRLSCIMVLRFFAKGKLESFVKKPRVSEASMTGLPAGSFPRNPAASANTTNQSHVIRIHTRRRKTPVEAWWPPSGPRARRFPQPPGNFRSSQKDPLAKNRRLFHWREQQRTDGSQFPRGPGHSQWGSDFIEALCPLGKLSKT